MDVTSYASPDGKITMTINHKDVSLERPFSGSTCIVFCENVQDDTQLIKEGEERVVVIGEAENEFDRILEPVLVNMTTESVATGMIITSQSMIRCSLKFIKYQDPPKLICDMTDEEKLIEGKRLKEKADNLINQKRYSDGIHILKTALKCICWLDPCLPDRKDLYVAVVANFSLCRLKMAEQQHVITLCSKVLDINDKHIKSLLRRATAYDSLEMPEKAKEDVEKALLIEPKNGTAVELLTRIKGHLSRQKNDYATLVRKMLPLEKK